VAINVWGSVGKSNPESEQSMTTQLLEKLHRDHRKWHSENSLWRDELRNWQYELYRATEGIAQLKSDLDAHGNALANHAAVIRLYDDELRKHELALARQTEDSRNEGPAVMSDEHALDEQHHHDRLVNHQRVKEHHHNVMKHLRGLLKALNEPM
jgi:hypothetical protein